MGFQRAARTDKGVSAVANLVSLKLVPLENLTELVNEQLPKQIRMFGKSNNFFSLQYSSFSNFIRCKACCCKF